MSIPLQIAFLTGQSNPGNAALSPAQSTFLDALPVAPAWKVRVNFPYPETAPPFRETSLPIASWNNLALYLRSRRPAFASAYRPAVLARIERADRTLFLAGSSGLELLGNLGLPAEVLARLHVFAYGPVARRLPDCDGHFVQGRDSISRLYFRVGLPPERIARVACNHLDYLSDPQVRDRCIDYLSELKAAQGIA